MLRVETWSQARTKIDWPLTLNKRVHKFICFEIRVSTPKKAGVSCQMCLRDEEAIRLCLVASLPATTLYAGLCQQSTTWTPTAGTPYTRAKNTVGSMQGSNKGRLPLNDARWQRGRGVWEGPKKKSVIYEWPLTEKNKKINEIDQFCSSTQPRWLFRYSCCSWNLVCVITFQKLLQTNCLKTRPVVLLSLISGLQPSILNSWILNWSPANT